MSVPPESSSGKAWTFFSNHGHVMIYVANNPDARVRDIAANVGITDRATQSILNDLVADDYLARAREGRRNTYRVNEAARLRHPAEATHQIGEVLRIFGSRDEELGVTKEQ